MGWKKGRQVLRMAISKMSNGFYTFSDSHFKSMRKQDLINYIRTIEKNWQNSLITNGIQYENCKRLLAEERNKTIEEFYDKVLNFEDYIEPLDTSEFGAVLLYSGKDITNMIVKIKEQLKAGGIDG